MGSITSSGGQILVDVTPLQDGSKRAAASVDGGQTFTLLNAALSPGTGTAFPLQPAILALTAKVFTMVLVEASPGAQHASVKLEGSLDGVNWYSLIATTLATGATALAVSTGTAFVQALYVRANITIAPTAGTVLTVQVACNN